MRLLVLGWLCLACARAEARLNDGEHSLVHGGERREFLLRVPPPGRKGKLPLVLALHGGGGNAEGFVPSTGLNAAAAEKGFLLAYPQGTGPRLLGKRFRTWNAGRCCGSAMKEKIDDVGFLVALIDHLVARAEADPKRVYVTGLSNGAMMSYRLACERADRIAAIAPVAAQGAYTGCQPSRPVPTMHFHGTADPCAPYGGGKQGNCFGKFLGKMGISNSLEAAELEPVPAFFAGWRKLMGVSGNGVISYRKGAAKCEAFGPRKEMILCAIEGAGHAWPGGNHGAVCKRPRSRRCRNFSDTVGPLTKDIDASREMLAFFDRIQSSH